MDIVEEESAGARVARGSNNCCKSQFSYGAVFLRWIDSVINEGRDIDRQRGHTLSTVKLDSVARAVVRKRRSGIQIRPGNNNLVRSNRQCPTRNCSSDGAVNLLLKQRDQPVCVGNARPADITARD